MLFKSKAPELKAIHWINSGPLSIMNLRGKIVVIDFWTYSCVNCLRSLPHMKMLWEKYKSKGLVMIGVHTPEFDFEKDIKNVKEAVRRLDITYPVAVDSDYVIWRAFGNQYWPRQYFIDKDGYVRHDHIGEGGEGEIEAWIVKLLREAGQDIEFKPEDNKETLGYGITSETYAGSLRNERLGGGGVCMPDGRCIYKDSGSHEPGIIYLDGEWLQKEEYLLLEGKGYVLLWYRGAEANAVMSGSGKAEILLDGKSLTKEQTGKDIVFESGRSFVIISRPDMYNLVRTKTEEHELKIIPSPNFRIYAYTFG